MSSQGMGSGTKSNPVAHRLLFGWTLEEFVCPQTRRQVKGPGEKEFGLGNMISHGDRHCLLTTLQVV